MNNNDIGAVHPQPPLNEDHRNSLIKYIFIFGAILIINIIIGKDDKYVSDFHSEKNISLLYPLLKPGDLLEYPRVLKYSHWAVYVGKIIDENGETHYRIIHHSTPPHSSPIEILSSRFTSDDYPKATIREDDVIDPLHLDLVRKNNAQDRIWEPFDGDEVVNRARKIMEDPEAKGYNLFTNNCEHFVNKCRYDKLVSNQVHKKAIDIAFAAAKKNEL